LTLNTVLSSESLALTLNTELGMNKSSPDFEYGFLHGEI